MLSQLHITNFAIIDEVHIEFNTGLTALTGETGAGKSILLDALGQVLGNRARSDFIKKNAEKSDITAVFDISSDTRAQGWLADRELEADSECLLRRVIGKDGKSRAFINGRPTTAQQLREFSAQLICIYGQNEHQRLASNEVQRTLLDSYKKISASKQVESAYHKLYLSQQQLEKLEQSIHDRSERRDLLSFQLQEFDALDCAGMNVADIESEHRWLANAEQLAALALESSALLDEPKGIVEMLAQLQQPLGELVSLDPRLQEALDLIDSATIQCEESARTLRKHVSNFEHDDNRMHWLNEKLSVLHQLSKKHRVTIEELDALEQSLRIELETLQNPDEHVEQLQNQITAYKEIYLQKSLDLTRVRKLSAKKLSSAVTESLKQLGMQDATLSIMVDTDPDLYSVHGQDIIQFLVRTNAGSDLLPIAKVASGGELSRLSLCIQLATIEAQPVQSLIFDEVDAGVGGATAEMVGKLLRSVGNHAQVLSVTHLPQVAAQAHHHMKVEKSSSKGKSITQLQVLDDKETIDEIARMLGGIKITAKSIQHAKEMLASSKKSASKRKMTAL